MHAALELLEQRERPVHGEESAGAHDEDDVAERIGVSGILGHEIDQWRVLRRTAWTVSTTGLSALLAFCGKPIFEGLLDRIASSRHSASDIRLTRLPSA